MFLGTSGVLSLLPLAALLDGGFSVSAIVVSQQAPFDPGAPPARRLEPPPIRLTSLPLLDAAASSVVELGWEREIPVLQVRSLRDPACRELLEPYRPDVICVSCFSQILPETVLSWPRLGCLNLHPSLLPAYRGPAPLFWLFRNGERQTGVTIHIMDPEIDSGDILLQEAFVLPEGVHGSELMRQCAERGARLMVDAVRALHGGAARPRKQADGASYYPWPTSEDFTVPVTRPARWAFHFIRGVAEWGPVVIPAADRRFGVREALDYAEVGTLGRAFERVGERWRIQFTPGVLEVTLAADKRG
jgi:methionyl-tRNA formyltransferase